MIVEKQMECRLAGETEVLGRAKTVHALDHSATVTGRGIFTTCLFFDLEDGGNIFHLN
jgi:hypothetical protein